LGGGNNWEPSFSTSQVLDWATAGDISFTLTKTEALNQNIGKVFQSQSWYQRTLFSVYAGANREATTSCWWYIQLTGLIQHTDQQQVFLIFAVVCLLPPYWPKTAGVPDTIYTALFHWLGYYQCGEHTL